MELLAFIGAVKGGGKPAQVGADALQIGVQRPVLLTLEVPDLLLPLTDQAGGHRLHTAGGQAPADLLPQKGGDLIAHHAVEHPSRLLGIHQVHIDLAGPGDGLIDHLLGDLVEGDPVGALVRQPQKLLEMPGDGLPLPVRVGGQVDLLAALGRALQVGDHVLFPRDGLVVHGKVPLHVHAHLALGEIPNVAHGGFDLIAGAQIFGDRLCLGR